MVRAPAAISASLAIACVYGIRKRRTNRWYIGSTINWLRRRAQHRGNLARSTHDSPILQAAYDKYGIGAFEFLILRQVKLPDNSLKSLKKLRDLERSYFSAYASRERHDGLPYYNVSHETNEPPHNHFTNVVRWKIGVGNRGKPRTLEVKAKIRAGLTGIKRSEETRERCRIAQRALVAQKRADGRLPKTSARERRRRGRGGPGYVDPRKGKKCPEISKRNKALPNNGISAQCRSARKRPEVGRKISTTLKARGIRPPRSPMQLQLAIKGTQRTIAGRHEWFGKRVSEGKLAAQAAARAAGSPPPWKIGHDAACAARVGKVWCRKGLDPCRKLVAPGTHCERHS